MEIFLIVVLTIVSSGIGTMTGFGTSTIMIPVMALFMPPVQAILLVSIIHWFGNVWKLLLFRSGFHLKLIALFGLSGLVASYAGASLSLEIDSSLLLRLLGVFLAAYALSLIVRTGIKIKAGDGTALLGGILSGFFAGVFGIGGAIRSAFLLAFNLPKAAYIATAGAVGLLVDTTRIITYLFDGTTLEPALWWGFMFFIPASFAGAWIAKMLIDKIPQKKFRGIVAVFLFVIALKLVFFP